MIDRQLEREDVCSNELRHHQLSRHYFLHMVLIQYEAISKYTFMNSSTCFDVIQISVTVCGMQKSLVDTLQKENLLRLDVQ